MLEQDIQSLILIYVTRLPCAMFWRSNTGAVKTDSGFIKFGVKGQPDIMGFVNGRFIGIEVKTKTGRQSNDQKNWERLCENAGGVYILARSAKDVVNRLRMEGIVK